MNPVIDLIRRTCAVAGSDDPRGARLAATLGLTEGGALYSGRHYAGEPGHPAAARALVATKDDDTITVAEYVLAQPLPLATLEAAFGHGSAEPRPSPSSSRPVLLPAFDGCSLMAELEEGDAELVRAVAVRRG